MKEPVKYMLFRNGVESGPYAWKTIAFMVKKGDASPNDQIWAEGMEEWIPIGRMLLLSPKVSKGRKTAGCFAVLGVMLVFSIILTATGISSSSGMLIWIPTVTVFYFCAWTVYHKITGGYLN